MTSEAKELRNAVVQTMRERLFSPRYRFWLNAPTIQQTDATTGIDGTESRCLWNRDLMILGSVLLPEEVAPEPTEEVPNPVASPYYLDDADVRDLIRTELAISPRSFIHNVYAPEWDARIESPGAHLGSSIIPRRFCTVDKSVSTGLRGTKWGLVAVPWQSEKDLVDSTIPVDAVVLPDFFHVTDAMRYKALGL